MATSDVLLLQNSDRVKSQQRQQQEEQAGAGVSKELSTIAGRIGPKFHGTRKPADAVEGGAAKTVGAVCRRAFVVSSMAGGPGKLAVVADRAFRDSLLQTQYTRGERRSHGPEPQSGAERPAEDCRG